MSTLRTIRGLSGAGFRIKDQTSGKQRRVNENTSIVVDVDDVATQLILVGERDNFIRTAELGTFTVTSATPAVFTKNGHGLLAGDMIRLSTTGALWTGLAVNTTYWVIATGLTTNSFQVALSAGGTAVNTSGSQSGTHTLTPVSARIIGLTKYGLRIRTQASATIPKNVKIGSGVSIVDLTHGGTRRNLRRSYGRYLCTSDANAITVRGMNKQQSGFELVGGAGTSTDVLTSTNVNVSNADTVVIGADTYTFKTALTEKKATAILSSNGTIPSDGDTVTVNNVTYRLKTTPALANDVKCITSSDVTLDNLVKAVNQSGVAGTDYFAGTVAPTGVTAAARVGTGATGKVTFTATTPGTAANAFPSTKVSTNLSFLGVTFGAGGGATVTGVNPVANEVFISVVNADGSLTNLSEAINGGANIGVDYSTTTVASTHVTSSAVQSGHKLTLTAKEENPPVTTAVSTTAVTLSFAEAAISDPLTRIYRLKQATVNPQDPAIYTQLRRFFKAFISV